MSHLDPVDGIFWAKLPRDVEPPRPYHPVMCHLLDVAAVAEALWQDVLTAAGREYVARALGQPEAAAARWVPFLAGLHDIGKVSEAFQFQVPDPEVRERLRQAGMAEDQLSAPDTKIPHGVITAVALQDEILCAAPFELSGPVRKEVATVLGGHHGLFPQFQVLVKARSVAKKGAWRRSRRRMAECLGMLFAVPEVQAPRCLDHPGAMFLAGLVSVADWIGSNSDYFPLAVLDPAADFSLDPVLYLERARGQAHQALEHLGWLGWSPASGYRSFADLFGFQPRGIQHEAIALAPQLGAGSMAIIEAPMGEGKTEAAMYLADTWNSRDHLRGCYFALPTQATSNQMFGRIRQFVGRRYPLETVNLQLLHGHAALSAEFQLLRRHANEGFRPKGVGDTARAGEPSGDVVAAEWFTYRKRGLLAPFGVGTIDQALLAVLQTKHVFVRLFGLAHKTVIIDEVHAYDTYMSTLLERLLEWLAALGTSVVLLSATLPRERRERLLAAYGRGQGHTVPPPPVAAYPRITYLSAGVPAARHVPAAATRSLAIEWLNGSLPATSSETFDLGEYLQTALRDGGCAAVICNTVGRAQRVYAALKAYFPGQADDGLPELDLFHARYQFGQRDAREKRTLLRFGKMGSTVETAEGGVQPVRRPQRSVLVATQVIEQSLDLDFDVMITDIAPADLLLQRSGRLWRHDDVQRPASAGLGPRLVIFRPGDSAEGVPQFDHGTSAVYDGHVLLRTWLALRDWPTIIVPDDMDEVIDAVYGRHDCPADLPPAVRAAWHDTLAAFEAEQVDCEAQAKDCWLYAPAEERVLWSFTAHPQAEDQPDLHPAHQALTRLAEPSVQVVCLTGQEAERLLTPYEAGGRRAGKPIPLAVVQDLLRQSLTLSDRRVVHGLLAGQAPRCWQDSALLCHSRFLPLGTRGESNIGPYTVRVDPELGVLIASDHTEGGPI